MNGNSKFYDDLTSAKGYAALLARGKPRLKTISQLNACAFAQTAHKH